MCRLFGFRSVIYSQVHASLVSAENALITQSNQHPDGWGVAYYVGSSPHIIRSHKTAISDQIFRKVSGVVSSQTVLAHLRKATQGSINVLDTHPFQFGNWVFAHNGNIKNFFQHRKSLSDHLDSGLSRYILGDTDSELIFFLILTHLQQLTPLHGSHVPVQALATAIKNTVQLVSSIVGPLNSNDKAAATETFLTMVITNGPTMVGFQGGKQLYYSTYKTRCSERAVCPSFSAQCERSNNHGDVVNHLIFASEPLQGENVWQPMNFCQAIGIDGSMQLSFI